MISPRCLEEKTLEGIPYIYPPDDSAGSPQPIKSIFTLDNYEVTCDHVQKENKMKRFNVRMVIFIYAIAISVMAPILLTYTALGIFKISEINLVPVLVCVVLNIIALLVFGFSWVYKYEDKKNED